ncbi:hypothetical protein B7P43_G09632 [Cryptotermes secundus]|uniref:Tc1-like transposase DDE domain-containing protein n=1 Tax=Cryptotermes secundus TaxID=105785 RepID=A0A2J7R7I2_9NEOP|nr:hypothetical protein B7P43_G09632 [Cryptotermes secundus]
MKNTRENILEMVQRSRRLSTRIGVSRMQVWRHYTRHVIHYLDESFPNRWLGRDGSVVWPPRSPDLTPLEYYLWGHMKTLVYETKVDSQEALPVRIFAAAEHIRHHPGNIAYAPQSLMMRAENCIAAGGGHFEQLL